MMSCFDRTIRRAPSSMLTTCQTHGPKPSLNRASALIKGVL